MPRLTLPRTLARYLRIRYPPLPYSRDEPAAARHPLARCARPCAGVRGRVWPRRFGCRGPSGGAWWRVDRGGGQRARASRSPRRRRHRRVGGEARGRSPPAPAQPALQDPPSRPLQQPLCACGWRRHVRRRRLRLAAERLEPAGHPGKQQARSPECARVWSSSGAARGACRRNAARPPRAGAGRPKRSSRRPTFSCGCATSRSPSGCGEASQPILRGGLAPPRVPR